MEEKKSFTKKPFAKKPYRVDAKALESKGFEVIRYDRHEAYAKIYRIDGRSFIGTVNPVTGDRTISKAGSFASVKDMEELRAAWDQLSEDVLGPRPTAPTEQSTVPETLTAPEQGDLTPVAVDQPLFTVDNKAFNAVNGQQVAIGDGKTYDIHDLTEGADTVNCPRCGKSHFSIDSATTTVLATPTVIRDGRIVPQPSINKTHTHCTCLECGEQFETLQDPLNPKPTVIEAK